MSEFGGLRKHENTQHAPRGCNCVVSVWVNACDPCECAWCASSQRFEPWWPWESRLLKFFISKFFISYISPLLFFCLVLLLFLSYPFLLLAHSPDFFFPKPPFSKSPEVTLCGWGYEPSINKQTNNPFSERLALLCGSWFCFVFSGLGYEYFSWRYVQHMLPYGTSLYACI